MSNTIVLPDDAPFNAEQRAWLTEFLSKALPGQIVLEDSGPSVPATILWGSQTGNSEGCAKKLAKAMKAANYEPTVVDMAQLEVEDLKKEKNLLIITSTYGDGEPPDNAASLYEYLMGDSVESLAGLKFSVLALGDTEYPDFCKCGIDIDARLAANGAERVYELVTCDVEYEEPFERWKKGVLQAFGGSSTVAVEAPAEVFEGYGKKNPYPSPVLRNYNLNGVESERETYHLELSLEGSELEYEAGDALGVLPMNPEAAVDELISHLPFKPTEEVPLPGGGETSLREALITSYDIRNLTKRFVETWQAKSGSPYLRSLVAAENREAMNDFCWGREVIDLVVDHPADFSDAEEFVSVLKKLQPRLYSIASSPKAHPGEVHLTIAIVRYQTHGRQRGGVCSTYVSDRLLGRNPGVFVHQNKNFRLPENGDLPVIMVGPGTGIAPFRAFIEERAATAAKGKNWLFFGNPHRATDYLYEDELEAYLEQGTLERLDLAFSRDQKDKIYVQDLMLKSGAELWKWLEMGAHFYVCGDASRMAKDVDAALHQIAQEHGKLSEEDATAYFKEMKKQKKYGRDVY